MAAKEKSKTVLYHAPFAQPQEFLILKENKDGTVDIGREDGTVVVRGCKVTDLAVHGHVTAQTTDESVPAVNVDEKILALLKGKSRDELLNQVNEHNFNAKDKIVVSPTASTQELIEKLAEVLTVKKQ